MTQMHSPPHPGETLRECELAAALLEVREDVKAGRVVVESVADHIKRLTSNALS